MRTITATDLTPAIAALFAHDAPTILRARAILAGLTSGPLRVDDTAHPTRALVVEPIYGTLYLAGRWNAAQIAGQIAELRTMGDLGISCWLDDPLNDMLPPDPEYDGTTYMFRDRDPSVALAQFAAQVPEGYEIEPRTAASLRWAFGLDELLATYGSEAALLRYTHAVNVMHNGYMVGEAATGAPVEGRIEVGVTIMDSYWGQGLATAACAALILRVEAKGLRPWWDCATHNEPSVRLARKFGFVNKRIYRYREWAGTNR